MGINNLTQRSQSVAQRIDHTFLNPQATSQDILALCQVADEYGFFSVCVSPVYIALASKALKDSSVKICTVVGFPTGSHNTSVKVFETEKAIKDGADEIDMVISLNALKEKNYEQVMQDIKEVVSASSGKTVKVILETCLLSPEEIKEACKACETAGAHFVKTSTGFSTGGATIADVKLMKECVGSRLNIKASGGIKNLKMAEEMIQAGADRLGTSSSVAIVTGLENKGTY